MWLNTAIGVVGGAVMIFGSYWLWRKSTSVKPGSYLYRLFEAHYQAWPFAGNREFAEAAETYIKSWAKFSLVLGIILIALGVCSAVL